MLSSMRFKEKLKCLIEQIVVSTFLLCIFVIIGLIGSNILLGLIGGFSSNIYYCIRSIIEAIYCGLLIFLGITILLHIFKIRYLDYYEIVKENSNAENIIINDNEKNKIMLEKKKEKIIIRDPEHSQSKFLTGIMKFIIMCIKFVTICTSIFFAISFVMLIMLLILSFLFVKTGLVFVGAFLGIISALIINFVILKILFNFIISKNNKKHIIAIELIISLILAGISIGLIFIGITKFNYIENSEINTEIEDVYITQMREKFYISNYVSEYFNLEYVETESPEIKIAVKHSRYYKVNFIEDSNVVYIHYTDDTTKIMEMVRNIINDINNKQNVKYDIPTIYVYASKDNIEKMQQNERN